MGRVVLEHPDGRRVGADEADLDKPSANPYNVAGRVVVDDGGHAAIRMGRPESEHLSLLAEGFKVVARIDEQGHEAPLLPGQVHTRRVQGGR